MKVKEHIFNSYRELVSGTEISHRFAQILLLVNFFQIIKNQFWQLAIAIQNNGALLDYVIKVTQFASVLRLMQKSNTEFLYEALVFGLWALINAMFILLIIYVYKLKKSNYQNATLLRPLRKVLVFWNFAMPFFMFDICLEAFFSTFVCKDSTLIAGFLNKAGTNSNYCSSVLRYVLIAASSQAILLLTIFAVLNACLFFDDSFNYSNSLARSNNSSLLSLLAVRTIVCVLAICSDYQYSAIVTSGIFLGLFILYAFSLHSYHTYYNIPLATLDMSLFLFQVAISAITLTQGIFVQASSGKIVPSFVLFCCFLFSLKFAKALAHKSIMYHIERRFNLNSNSISLEKKIKLLYANIKFHKEETRNDKLPHTSEEYLKSSGYLIKAIEDNKLLVSGSSSEPNIIFDPLTKQTIDIKVTANSQKLQSSTYIKHLIKLLYQQAINHHPKASNLRIGFASFLLVELQHIYLSILECIQINRLFTLGTPRQYQVASLYKEIAKLFKDLNKMSEDDDTWSSFDLERLLFVETNFQNLHQSLLRFFLLSKELYDYVLSERPNLSILEQKAVVQLDNYAAIGNSFEKVKTNPRSLRLYIDFLREVMGDNKTARVLETKLKQLTDKLIQSKFSKQTLLDPDLAYNEDSTIITIGGTRENIGRIIKANHGVEKLFGHKKEELNMSNIKRLMPLVLGEKHDTFLNNFLETSRMTVLYKERKLYGRHKEGHIFSLNLLVKPMFDTSQNLLQFISFIQPLSQDADHLITDSSGLICGISKNMGKMMKLNPLTFETTKVYLPTLAPKSLYLFLEDMEQQKLMKKKSSSKRQLSFKRVETDVRHINKTQEGEFLFHVYVSQNLVESSARLYDPQNPPESHESLKGNFEGTEVFKIRCSANSFESSDQSTRLMFFFVTEVEFLYKKKTRSAVANAVSSYKTWDKMFFTRLKQTASGGSENPLNKLAFALKKNFHIKLEETPPSSVKSGSGGSRKSSKLRTLVVKAITTPQHQLEHQEPGVTFREAPSETENPENNTKKEPEISLQKDNPKIVERKETVPDKTPPRLIVTNEFEEAQPLMSQPSDKRVIQRDDSMSNLKNIDREDSAAIRRNNEREDSMVQRRNIDRGNSFGTSYQKTLSSGNTLTVERVNTFHKKTSNELLPGGRFGNTLFPIQSELEIESSQNIEDESSRGKGSQGLKPSLLQIDQVSRQNLLSISGSMIGTKILSVAQLAQWTDNANRPHILDNPPINSDSEVGEEEEEEREELVEKDKNEKTAGSGADRLEIGSTRTVGFSLSSDRKNLNMSSNIGPSNNSSRVQDSSNTESFEDYRRSEHNTSTMKKSVSIGSVMKFYTDYSKQFKRLLQKTKTGFGRREKKDRARFRDATKAMVEEKLRNYYEHNEGSISSGSSKQSNTTKKFVLDAIHHEYIPKAFFYFRAILYLCFVFLIASTIALSLQQSQIFSTLENNYDNGHNYANYITQIARLGSSVYDLLYLKVNFYASSSAAELTYLHDLSSNKTADAIRTILANYPTVRTESSDYFVYNDYTNTSQIDGQSLDLPQSIFQLCSSGLYILSGLHENSVLDSVLPYYEFILRHTSPIVNQMSSKINLDNSIDALKSNKTIAIVVLVICILAIVVLWLIAVRSIFKCYVEIQKVLVLFINLPNVDLIELRNIMDQALHTLQNNEFKWRPPPFHPGGKFSIKRFIPLHFPRVKILAAGSVLLILGVLSYTLTIANSHGFDNSLEGTLRTASQIDVRLYEKFDWQLSLKDIYFYETQGYNFNVDVANTSALNQLYSNISETFAQEANILSQVENYVAPGSDGTHTGVNAVLQNSLCSNPSISINRTSSYSCLFLFSNALLQGN